MGEGRERVGVGMEGGDGWAQILRRRLRMTSLCRFFPPVVGNDFRLLMWREGGWMFDKQCRA
jgi:hypothetical protein